MVIGQEYNHNFHRTWNGSPFHYGKILGTSPWTSSKQPVEVKTRRNHPNVARLQFSTANFSNGAGGRELSLSNICRITGSRPCGKIETRERGRYECQKTKTPKHQRDTWLWLMFGLMGSFVPGRRSMPGTCCRLVCLNLIFFTELHMWEAGLVSCLIQLMCAIVWCVNCNICKMPILPFPLVSW